ERKPVLSQQGFFRIDRTGCARRVREIAWIRGETGAWPLPVIEKSHGFRRRSGVERRGFRRPELFAPCLSPPRPPLCPGGFLSCPEARPSSLAPRPKRAPAEDKRARTPAIREDLRYDTPSEVSGLLSSREVTDNHE